ncbi:MAG: carbohydrate-binding family 9-like protein [Victivallales bacterium]
MKIALLLQPMLLVSGFISVSGGNVCRDVPLFSCPLVRTSPVIDGKLEDQAWKEAFCADLVLNSTGNSPRQATKVFVAYDRKNLYVAFHCSEADMAKVIARKKERDSPVYHDDCVEVFIAAGKNPRRIYHFITNMLGTRFDEIKEKRIKNRKWNSEWQVAARKGENSWSTEFAISFAVLGGSPREGDCWRINFCREEKPCNEDSSWAPTGYGFWNPGKYGRCRFAGENVPTVKQINPYQNIILTASSGRKNLAAFSVSGKRKGRFVLKTCFIPSNGEEKIFAENFSINGVEAKKIKVDYSLPEGAYYGYAELADPGAGIVLYRSRKILFSVYKKDPRLVYLKKLLDECNEEFRKPRQSKEGIQLFLKQYKEISSEVDKLYFARKPTYVSSAQWKIIIDDEFLRKVENLHKNIQQKRK